MRRPHVYERTAPQRSIRSHAPIGPGPYADGYAAQRRGAERDPPDFSTWADNAEDAAGWRAGWPLGYDGSAIDAERIVRRAEAEQN